MNSSHNRHCPRPGHPTATRRDFSFSDLWYGQHISPDVHAHRMVKFMDISGTPAVPRAASARHRGGPMAQRKSAPLVGVLMGSDSDWEIMRNATMQLDAFGIAYEARVISA